MQHHRFASLFQLLPDGKLQELAADIKANGLLEAVWIYEGKILDGRNRARACEIAGVKLRTRKYLGNDPIGFVLSLNKHRRHLTLAELAAAASKAATMRQGERTDLTAGSGKVEQKKSQAQAAKEVGISVDSVQRFNAIDERGSEELKAAVQSGKVSLSRGAKAAQLPKDQQLPAAEAEPEYVGPEPEEMETLAAIEREQAEALDKILAADDKLAAAVAECKRQAAEIGVLKLSRDGFMEAKSAVVRMLKQAQRTIDRQDKRIKALTAENEQLRERVAIMDAA